MRWSVGSSENKNPAVLERVATALANKGCVLGAQGRPQDALDAYDEVVRRFGDSEAPALTHERLSGSTARESGHRDPEWANTSGPLRRPHG